jgi:hypothetical protein
LTPEARALALASLDAAQAAINAARAALGNVQITGVTEPTGTAGGVWPSGSCPKCNAPASKLTAPAYGTNTARTCTVCGWEG